MPAECIETLALTKREWERVELIAKQKGITTDEAASLLFSAGLAKRVRRNTGKAPAKVYKFRGRV